MSEKELLFSVTAADCDWQYMRGTGPGGQKRNKTDTKVRCTHRASGAVGESDLTRSQHQNKSIAFRKMVETEVFRKWHKLEVARRTGQLLDIERELDRQMHERNILTEVKENGKWTPKSVLELTETSSSSDQT